MQKANQEFILYLNQFKIQQKIEVKGSKLFKTDFKEISKVNGGNNLHSV